jgi:molybdopterin molybdotransferase
VITFDQAVALIAGSVSTGPVETVKLDRAAGRILAAPVTAQIDSPRADVSAMDGYAVRGEDLLSCPASLDIVGESFAGASWIGRVEAGQCVRIFTGAPVPEGADRVVIQENVRREGRIAWFDAKPGAARHIRKRGNDFRAGEKLLPAGHRLDPRAIVTAAGSDLAELQVYSRPRVTILSTGDELAEPGTARARVDAIPESVSFGVSALGEQWGASVIARQRLADDVALMTEAAGMACAVADLVIVTGGASVGEKDYAKRMFEPHGLELIFSKVAMKPGKPVWLGRAGGALVMGLPGNPTSAMVTARLLLAPLICRLTGRGVEAALNWQEAPLSASLPPCGGRETFHRARLADGKVQLLSNQDSSAQQALASADILVRQLPDGPEIPAGTLAPVIDF